MPLNTFANWWNRLARTNQKVKFRNAQEAADYVRHLARTSAPNPEIVKLRENYVAIQKEAERRRAIRPSRSNGQAA